MTATVSALAMLNPRTVAMEAELFGGTEMSIEGGEASVGGGEAGSSDPWGGDGGESVVELDDPAGGGDGGEGEEALGGGDEAGGGTRAGGGTEAGGGDDLASCGGMGATFGDSVQVQEHCLMACAAVVILARTTTREKKPIDLAIIGPRNRAEIERLRQTAKRIVISTYINTEGF
ncbi:hypothetical protein MLD38_032386 [Melastoma candidum]|uniref:Uncharacterized protein n=1 Tax=Melastoma candidum TaxID=119954 RepID=A0ACB9M421_9MYRT|nr:hypothetical protein MLD38_032386 [Melastoma candidum]